MQNGAYKTTVRYLPDSGGVRYVYRDQLPKAARRFVLHDIAAAAAATGDQIPVVLRPAIFRYVQPGDPIPGTLWDPDYLWPPPDTAPAVVPQPAPAEDRAAFLSAALALKNATNRAIAAHYLTTRDNDPEDQIVRAVDWLITFADKAKELTDG